MTDDVISCFSGTISHTFLPQNVKNFVDEHEQRLQNAFRIKRISPISLKQELTVADDSTNFSWIKFGITPSCQYFVPWPHLLQDIIWWMIDIQTSIKNEKDSD